MRPNISTIDLAGQWRFSLDRDDLGEKENWQLASLPGTIPFPCSLAEQRIGDSPSLATDWTAELFDGWIDDPRYAPYHTPDNFKMHCWLQPETVYVGAAWYQRDIEIPEEWSGKRITLYLERPHIQTSVWLDNIFLGTQDSLSVGHTYVLRTSPGKHTLTVKVDNRMPVDVGINSHSVSDHTQGNWNGVVGTLVLKAANVTWIDDVQVYPDVQTRSAAIACRIGNVAPTTGGGRLRMTASIEGEALPSIEAPISWTESGGQATVQFGFGTNAKLWDEFHPNVYTLSVELLDEHGNLLDSCLVQTGLREVKTDGSQIAVNGNHIFIRGTLECCIFPKTGYPPMERPEWSRIFRIVKNFGLNCLRFHSWCPPEAAFDMADEEGVYLQVECSSWASTSTRLGNGEPIDDWLYKEGDRILRAYGNHPSFLLMLYGNEPSGENKSEYLSKWVATFKQKDDRRLYSSGSGWPEVPENDFHVTPAPRIHQWGAALNSRINALPPETITDYREFIEQRQAPVISHEIGQWCAYPNFGEMQKYTGHLKPKNFEIYKERLEKAGMLNQARDFLLASGKLQTLCYKEEIESALRTPGMGGFELLDLHDFPGQGTALVGVLDPFWETKGYVTPQEYRRFCGPTVPLARLSRRVFTVDETFEAEIDIARYGNGPLNGVNVYWSVVDGSGLVSASGEFPDVQIAVGITRIGKLSISLDGLAAPSRYKLQIGVEGVDADNDWDIWIYPSNTESRVPKNVLLACSLNAETLEALASGRRVVISLPPGSVGKPDTEPVAMGFSSIFWNTNWTKGQPPHTLGILCNPCHALFANFPTDSHTNWQWWYLIHKTEPLILDRLPERLRPTVQVIDDWTTCHRLGLVVEARVGPGRLVVTSIDLNTDAADPVRKQFRQCLLEYASSDEFAPTIDLTIEDLKTLTTAF